MSSWWDLGEHSGYEGTELALYQVTCPFCLQRGNYKRAHHIDWTNGDYKTLNYDIYQCVTAAITPRCFGRPVEDDFTIGTPSRGRAIIFSLRTLGRKMSAGSGFK